MPPSPTGVAGVKIVQLPLASMVTDAKAAVAFVTVG